MFLALFSCRNLVLHTRNLHIISLILFRMLNARKNETDSLKEHRPNHVPVVERLVSQNPAVKSAPIAQDCGITAEKLESKKPEAKLAPNGQDCCTTAERPETQKQEVKSVTNAQDCSTMPSKLGTEKQRKERKRCGGFQVYVPPPQRNDRVKLQAARAASGISVRKSLMRQLCFWQRFIYSVTAFGRIIKMNGKSDNSDKTDNLEMVYKNVLL